MPDKVYTVPYNGPEQYFHEDRDCPKLESANNVYEKERSVLPEDANPCPACCPEPELELADLTSFQQYILLILAEEARYGLAVKDELEDLYDQGVPHGRLYPNLASLIDRGYVEKSEMDGRTNEYALTKRGREALIAEARWRVDRLKAGSGTNGASGEPETAAVTDGGQR